MMGYFESQEEAGGHQWGPPGRSKSASSCLLVPQCVNLHICTNHATGPRRDSGPPSRPLEGSQGPGGPERRDSMNNPIHVIPFFIICQCQILTRASTGGEQGQPRIPCGCDKPQTCPAPPPVRPKSPKPEPKARSRWKGS